MPPGSGKYGKFCPQHYLRLSPGICDDDEDDNDDNGLLCSDKKYVIIIALLMAGVEVSISVKSIYYDLMTDSHSVAS